MRLEGRTPDFARREDNGHGRNFVGSGEYQHSSPPAPCLRGEIVTDLPGDFRKDYTRCEVQQPLPTSCRLFPPSP
jgi:hypothetical protein